MLPTILNEQSADQEVIINLLRAIASMKGYNIMPRFTIFKDLDGQICRATQFFPVSREELTEAIAETQTQLDDLNIALVTFDAMNPPQDKMVTDIAPCADPNVAVEIAPEAVQNDTQTIPVATESLVDVPADIPVSTIEQPVEQPLAEAPIEVVIEPLNIQ